MCVESMGWGTIGTTADDGVRRCRVRGWVLVLGQVSGEEGMGGARRIGGTIGGIFLPPPAYELKCVYAQVHIVQLSAFLCMIFEFWSSASGRLLDLPLLVFDFCIHVVIECSVDRGTVGRGRDANCD